MIFEKEKVEEHFDNCKVKNAQECPVCKPYVNGIIKATYELKELEKK